MTLELDVFTLFPGYFDWLRESRPVRNAVDAGSLRLRTFDLRDHAPGEHRQVDDTPYGGGAGMVIRVDIVCAALEATYGASIERVLEARRVAVLTPVGRVLTDAVVTELAALDRLTLLCGRYEGFDERIRLGLNPREISVGDFVCNGGEVPAMVVIDTVVRYVPGVLGDEQSAGDDSFAAGLLEGPQYTRPPEFRGMRVPEVLLSGNHEAVAKWRAEQAHKRTKERRPDLLG